MEYIPEISEIETPEVFEEDYKHHGEVHEMYFCYFARITELKGVAVNGWSSRDAGRIFESVDKTFIHEKSKFKKAKDFEIDWLFFNGSTITVIEVKEMSDKGRGNKNFDKKFKQIKKDRIILEHLLEAAGCRDITVNYVIACPNVAVTEVTGGKFLTDHEHTLKQIR